MVNRKARITKIMVLVREYAYIHRIKFLDPKDIPILDLTFDDREEGKWSTLQLQEDEDVIGLFCSTAESFP